jgi:serine O-acetyltransferase
MANHRASKIYNLSRKLYIKKVPEIFPKLLWLLNRVIFSCDISYHAEIDRSVDFFHNGLGVVIGRGAKIDKNTVIYQNVTIGGNGKEKLLNGHPRIGSNVTICANAVIMGPIIIGDGAIIGAGAIVITDIPTNAVAVGVPAKVIKYN